MTPGVTGMRVQSNPGTQSVAGTPNRVKIEKALPLPVREPEHQEEQGDEHDGHDHHGLLLGHSLFCHYGNHAPSFACCERDGFK